MSAAALTLATFNTARISKLETQIAHNNKRLDHLVDITALHEQHFKAVDQKLTMSLANFHYYSELTKYILLK
jgi:hypothetical protein